MTFICDYHFNPQYIDDDPRSVRRYYQYIESVEQFVKESLLDAMAHADECTFSIEVYGNSSIDESDLAKRGTQYDD